MHIQISHEQREMVDALSRLLRDQGERPWGVQPSALWEHWVELGLPLMRAGEKHDGLGATLLDPVLVAEEMGRHGVFSALLTSIVSYALLDTLDLSHRDLGQSDSLPALAIALHDLHAEPRQFVAGLKGAKYLLGLANDQLWAVPVATLTITDSHEVTAWVDLPIDRTGWRVLAEGKNVARQFQAGIVELKLLIAAFLCGLSLRATADAAEYSVERTTFGRPIGSYQGVAHPLADARTEAEGSSLLVWRAVAAIAQNAPDAPKLCASAVWWAARSSKKALIHSMRVFGGYGMTDDSHLPHFFRCGRNAALLFGDTDRALVEDLQSNDATTLPTTSEITVNFDFDAQAMNYAHRTEAFLDANFTAADKVRFAQSNDNHFFDLHKKLAHAGLLYPDWETEHGGEGASVYATSCVRRVLGRRGWPISVIVVTDMIGKMIARFGTSAAKAEILPKLASGDALCCLGLSEPSGGSDVFAAKTRASRNGDNWVVNGQKVFTTSAHIAEHVYLLTRTEADENHSAGLTLFIAPMQRPGFESHPVRTFAGERTNITFYADFGVDGKYLLGEAGKGTKILTESLKLEHNMGDYYLAPLQHVYDELSKALPQQLQRPELASNRTAIELSMARLYAHIAMLDVLTLRSQWSGQNSCAKKWYGPMSKLFGTEAWSTLNNELVERLAPLSLDPANEVFAALEREARRGIPATIYGGTNEIQRSIIAETALSMPRSRA